MCGRVSYKSMATFDRETIFGIVADGRYSRKKAGILQGAPLTAEQRKWWDEAEILRDANAESRKERVARAMPQSGAARMSAMRARENAVPRAAPEDPARRKRLERAPEKWLRWYFPNVFTLPFSDGHRAIINAVLSTDATGKNMVVAAPRGEGKTNILRYLSIYLVFTARARFVVVGGWQNRAASEAFSTWCIALTSERLVADYPEFCAPFAVSTHANRLPKLHWAGEEQPTGANIRSARMQIVFPDGRGAMAAGSLQGDIKGLNITTRGGASLRPDKLLLDDPQDTSRAADPLFVQDVLHKIDTQWLCLAGPNARISMMVACTIFAQDDVGESIGKRKDSVFVRIPRVTSWPEDFDKPESMARTLWERWYDLYCDEGTRKEAFAFYRRNKAAMCKGFTVSWRYRFDKSKGDPDACFSAMVDYFAKGRDAFFSEYQNAPIDRDANLYDLTPQCVQSHAVDLKQNEVPDDTVLTVITTDINFSYGLTYEVAAFTRARTCHVLARGVWCDAPLPVTTKNTNQDQRQEKVREALGKMSEWISFQPWKIDLWLIDAGGEQFETVTSFCRAARKEGRLGRAIIGRAGKSYNPMTRTQFGRVRARVYQCFTRESGRWMCFDADHYKEVAQTSWITPVGLTGSASIYAGTHRDYADQMCREVLEAKGVLEARNGSTSVYVYRWNTKPGKHDYLDCHAMAYAAAGYEGLLSLDADVRAHAVGGASGAKDAPKRSKRRVYHG